jgi:hypothetical protein
VLDLRQGDAKDAFWMVRVFSNEMPAPNPGVETKYEVIDDGFAGNRGRGHDVLKYVLWKYN